MKELDKKYSPRDIEGRIYKNWEESGYFKAERVPGKKPFVIMMPPPNITGQLHMGHALDAMPQDALARYHRMKGEPTLWLPGTDHASIATEVKLVEALEKEGLHKRDIGREAFLERAWQWRDKYGSRITEQQRTLGASCDWSRERFTLDEGLNRAVVEVFVRLYEEGLIYRGDRIINWCPGSRCRTALSDAEVVYEEREGSLWYIRYPAPDGGEGVVVATTRPETMLGDTGVAVNPEDERYSALVGKTVILPILNREIPIVADDYVDKEFGTGAVKMTPAHDPNDFEVGLRHNLAVIRVIADDGTMNENAGRFAGMTCEDCRAKIIEELSEAGLLIKTEKLVHNVGTCYRCHSTVEPLTSKQWFVKMGPLAAPAVEAVKNGDVKFVPERFEKTYLNWMENIRDWCVSRQLWWGHRIPAYYCDECGEVTVAREAPNKCPKCGGSVHQDEDVLDTWFSSALWPFSTLGWPEETEDFKYFYPTSVLCCGYDIIFFWAARMIFSGLKQTGKAPFHTVLFHGLVRDANGEKMSKSKGNGIDPIEMIDKYGADALRISLALGVSPGNDMRLSEEKLAASRNFANKLWNAARFAMMNMEGFAPKGLSGRALEQADKWILSRYQKAVRAATGHFDSFDLGLAAQTLYDFLWDELCDWYIELAKARLSGPDGEEKEAARETLYFVLNGTLRLMHPFMPFITEEIYQSLPGTEGTIMLAPWPEADPALDFPEAEDRMAGVMDAIRAIRNARASMNVAPSRRARLIIRPSAGWLEALTASDSYFKRLAGASEVSFIAADAPDPEKAATAVCAAGALFLPLGDLTDLDKERARLKKELENLRGEIARAESKLANPGFVAKAPAQLVEAEQRKLTERRELLNTLSERAKELE